MGAEPYSIQYAEEAVEDIKALRAYDQRKILDGIQSHLHFSPSQVSRTGIKKMLQPFWSQYRLRIEDFRVYYDVDEARHTVNILRVLKKGQRETPKEISNETNRTDA